MFFVIEFNEKIFNLRYEDMFFVFDVKKNKINVIYIDNFVIYLGLESSEVFLRKFEEFVNVLYFFLN